MCCVRLSEASNAGQAEPRFLAAHAFGGGCYIGAGVMAVDHPDLRHHHNCVVFPQRAAPPDFRPLQHQTSGGDLDGDDYLARRQADSAALASSGSGCVD